MPSTSRLCLTRYAGSVSIQLTLAAHYVSPNSGGFAADRDAIDFVLAAQGTLDRVIEQYLDAENSAAAAADIGTGQ